MAWADGGWGVDPWRQRPWLELQRWLAVIVELELRQLCLKQMHHGRR